MNPSNDERLSGSYALVTVHDREDRIGVMQAIAGVEQVMSSCAVDGDYDIVVQIRELPGAGIDRFVSNKIRTIHGVKVVEVCRVELACEANEPLAATEANASKTANTHAQCYLFLETDKVHFEDIFAKLSVLQSVACCEVASGQYSLVLRLEASSFDNLDKIINEKIRPLPGVLRAKESRIIKLAGF